VSKDLKFVNLLCQIRWASGKF